MEATNGSLPPGVTVFERGWLSANNVLHMGPDSTALVDSGYATHAQQTLDLVRTTLAGRPLDVLVNTHLHSDHCGGNASLQQAYPSLETMIPPGEAAQVLDWDAAALTYAATGQQCPRFGFQELAIPGTNIVLGARPWEVHAAPGHDPHSIVLFEPVSRTLLSADALWENGFGVVFQELEGLRAFDAVAATLDLIESLDAAVVIPGHGRVFSDAGAALARARSRLEAYASSPVKHAAHAAKVLLKFKLLEMQHLPLDEFSDWAAATPYFQLVHRRWFATGELREWVLQLFAELERSGVARSEHGIAINL